MQNLLVIVMLLCCISLSGQQLTSQQKATISQMFKDYQEIPGVAIGIFQKGQISFSQGYGFANMETQETVTANTIFDLASVSKQITAGCIYLLQEQGKLSVNDDIRKYIPSLPAYEEGPIQIKHLLGHSSGLRSYLKLLHVKGIPWDSEFSNTTGVKLLSNQKGINFEPGTKFSYSNSGYMLLAKIIEEASGISFAAYAKEYLFSPLGMDDTQIGHPANMQNGLAIGYALDGKTFIEENFTKNTSVGDGGVYSTILDMFKWSENLRTAKVGGSAWKENMLQSGILKNGKETNYAGGLFLGDYQNIPGLYTIGHSGEWGGYRSLFFKFVEQDIAFMILSNNANTNVWSILNQMVPIVMKDELETARSSAEAVQSPEDVPKISRKGIVSDLTQYTGNYFNPVEGYTRKINLKNDTLQYVRTNGVATALEPLKDDSFQFLGMPNVKLDFNLQSSPMQLLLHINDDAPIRLNQYTEANYSNNEMQHFVGAYYSEELDVNYHIETMGNQLSVLLNEKELVRLHPVMENVFNDVHFGYLRFETDAQNRITGFTINDELVSNIYFKRVS